jgi:hypothetical protein
VPSGVAARAAVVTVRLAIANDDGRKGVLIPKDFCRICRILNRGPLRNGGHNHDLTSIRPCYTWFTA